MFFSLLYVERQAVRRYTGRPIELNNKEEEEEGQIIKVMMTGFKIVCCTALCYYYYYTKENVIFCIETTRIRT